MLPAASLRKPAWAILARSLPSSISFFGSSGLAKAGVAFSSTLVIVSAFVSGRSVAGPAAAARVPQLVEPFHGARLRPAGHLSKAHHASGGEHDEHRQRDHVFEVESDRQRVARLVTP